MFHHCLRRRGLDLGALLVAALLLCPALEATKLKSQNLTQLIQKSESILAGTVTSVTDGIDENGVPYTEVTVAVATAAKGPHREGSEYTFRQFGLTKPRTDENGLQYLAVSPAGFPAWHEGESVVAFLFKPASRTGLQTTAGLGQGKLNLINGELVNQFQNYGMFDGVEIDENLLSDAERNMLTSAGPVDAATFLKMVGRAVTEGWIENGEMR